MKLYTWFIAIFTGLFSHSLCLYAQEVPIADVIDNFASTPQSPQVASIMKFGNIPISHYTGVPNIDIPIYNLKSIDLEVPISLKYHASGVKVNEVAGDVGLGWSLIAGGIVTRNVMDKPDEFSGGYPLAFYPIPLPGFESTSSGGLSTAYSEFANLMDTESLDLEPDVWSYSMPGHSGKFVYDQTNTPQFIPKNSFKVIKSNEAITIIDANGNKYEFSLKEINMPKKWLVNQGSAIINRFQLGTFELSTSFYLTKITSPSGDYIDFVYEPYNYKYTESLMQVKYDLLPSPSCSPSDLPLDETWLTQRQFNGYRLKEIVTRTGYKSIFEYDNSFIRQDMLFASGGPLQSVKIKHNDRTIKEIILKHTNISSPGYSESLPDSIKANFNRLFLSEIIEKGIGSYNLQYFNDKPLPERFSNHQDLWGYHTLNNSNTLIPAVNIPPIRIEDGSNRAPKDEYAISGTLRRIEYPTGGYTELEYECHDYSSTFSPYPEDYESITKGLAAVVGLEEKPSQTLTFTIPQEAVVLPGDSTVMVTLSSRSSNDMELHGNGVVGTAFVTIQGPKGLFLTANGQSTTTVRLPIGEYTVNAITSGVIDPENQNEIGAYASLTLTWTQPKIIDQASNFKNIKSGGLRVKSITDNSLFNQPKVTRYFEYNELETGKSTGYLPSENSMLKILKLNQIQKLGVINLNSGDGSLTGDESFSDVGLYSCWFFIRSSNGIHEPGSIHGTSVGYSAIREIKKTNEEKHVIEFKYPVIKDGVDESINMFSGSLSGPIPANVTQENDWLRGMMSEKNIYSDKNGSLEILVKEKYFYKLFHNPSDFLAFNQSPKTNPFLIPFNSNVEYVNYASPESISTIPPAYNVEKNLLSIRAYKMGVAPSTQMSLYNIQYYKYVSAFIAKYYSETTHYHLGLPKLKEASWYYYDNQLHYLPTRIYTKTGHNDLRIIINKYVSDLGIPASYSGSDDFSSSISLLISKNQLNLPLEQSRYLNNKIINSSFLKYKTYPNIGVKPFESYEIGNKIDEFSPVKFENNLVKLDQKYYLKTRIEKFNENSKPLQIKQLENGIQMSLIWKANSSIPIARILNCQENEVAYSNFEDGEVGYWTYTGQRNNDAFSGEYSYDLSSGSVTRSNINSTKVYVVSMACKGSGTITVNGESRSINSPSKWEIISFIISNPNSINITGTTLIDELRLHPEDAIMTSYHYKPGVGLLEILDENLLSTSFEYDENGRLINTLDFEKNLLQSFEYFYVNGD